MSPHGSEAASATPTLAAPETGPHLCFVGASFGVHLLLSGIDRPGRTPSQDRFTYHQREFVSYAHRDAPPFELHSLHLAPALAEASCRMPSVTSERAGRAQTIPARPATRRFAVTASRAQRSTSTTSSVSPRRGRAGKARLPPRSDPRGLVPPDDAWVRFGSADAAGDLVTLVEAIRRAHFPGSRVPLRPAYRGEPPDRPYLTGSIQLQTSPDAMRSLVTELLALQDPAPRADAAGEDHRRLLALSGVLRALLAFDDTHTPELPSIFKETIVDRRLITTVHKGTFLRIGHDMRLASPYFLLPHSIALHNEALLDLAVSDGAAEIGVRPGGRDQRQRVGVTHRLEDTRRRITLRLEQQVDAEAIHYPNLRGLYERAAKSRGLDGLDARARRYADELRVESEAARNRQQSIAQFAIALTALIVGAVQVHDVAPIHLGVPGAVVLVVALVWLLPMLARLGSGLLVDLGTRLRSARRERRS